MTLLVPNRDSVTTIADDGSRRFVHPADVRGRFTRWRTLAGLVLTAIYVGLPWLRINGNPAVFFDIANRQFHLFGFTLVTQDLWLAFFLISGLGFWIFFITALMGRVWCGWACPQTVFLDIIRRIERWIEGTAPRRRQLDRAPWTAEKTLRRGLKYAVFAAFALLLAHVFLSYFVSLPGLYSMMREAPGQHWGAFVFVFLMGAALWFDFAWFREQFCIVICPYGRLQSALIDAHSLVIGYDTRRGEPRGRKGTPGAGDCVNCLRCVQVCPTGIDIRQGLQMECIGCAACVDACDTVMEKIGRPRGLVRYTSLNALAGKATRIIRPRILLYTALMLLGAAALTAGLSTLHAATVSFTRMTGAPYFLDDASVRNQFMLRVINKRNRAETFHVEFVGAPNELTHTGAESIALPPLGEQVRPIVVSMPRGAVRAEFPVKVRVVSADGRTSIEKTLPFIGPGSYAQ